MKKLQQLFLLSLVLLSFGGFLNAQVIGDPGWVFDGSGTVTGFWNKQQRWADAGVEGGIRNPDRNVTIQIRRWMNNSRIQTELNNLSSAGGGVANFQSGTYTITQTINVPKNVVLQGTGSSTIIKDALSTNNSGTDGKVIEFNGLTGSNGHVVGGIRRMRFEGPFGGTPNHYNWSDTRSNANNIMINILRSENIFLDQVTIINSGGSPVSTFRGGHHTIRRCTIDGVWNKGSGGHGYFSIQSGDCLIYDNFIQHLRHFTIQKSFAQYNVVFKNTINQDINFHNDDGGNNLIEDNDIRINSSLASAGGATRYTVMGPWSDVHKDSRTDNYVYHNTVLGQNKRCQNNSRLYKGARGKEPNKDPGNNPFSTYETVGSNKRFYSVRNGSARSRVASAQGTAEESVTEQEIAQEFGLNIYPNPVKVGETLHLTLPDDMLNGDVRVVDMNGKILLEKFNITEKNLDLTLQAKGLNHIQFIKGERTLKFKLFVE